MNPSVRAWTNGFASITSKNKSARLRYQSELQPMERLCGACDKIVPIRLFQGVGETFLNCSTCRSKGKPERRTE